MDFENCDDYKTLLTDNRTSDRYIKCDHCGYHNNNNNNNNTLGDLVDAVDTFKNHNHNHKRTYLPKPKPKPKNIVQKIRGLFHCC